MLGHVDIKTTSIPLNVTLPGLHESVRQFDEADPLTDRLRMVRPG